jgi:hypothetical protein
MQPIDKDRPEPATGTAARPVELPPFPQSAAERPPTTATTGEEVRAVVLGGLAGVGFGLMLMTVGVLLFHAPTGGALLVLLVGGALGAVVVGTHSSGTGALVGAVVGLFVVGFIIAPRTAPDESALNVVVFFCCLPGAVLGALVGVFIAQRVRPRERT